MDSGYNTPPSENSGLRITQRLWLPFSEITIRRSRSSGPGGQHANVTESRVATVFDVEGSNTLSEFQKDRITRKIGAVVTASSQDERSQLRNREIALQRLAVKLKAALAQPKPRRPTKPSAAAKRRQVEVKRRQAQKKAHRRRPTDE